MSDIIDLNDRRNEREQPDPEFVMRDDFGRPMYTFTLSYDMDGSLWLIHLWAYSHDDAERRVEAMRQSLKCDGQVYAVYPA